MGERLPILLVDDDGDELRLLETIVSATDVAPRLAGDPLAFADALAEGAIGAAVVSAELTWADPAAAVGMLRRRLAVPVIALARRSGGGAKLVAAGAQREVRRDATGLLELARACRHLGPGSDAVSEALELLGVPLFRLARDGTMTGNAAFTAWSRSLPTTEPPIPREMLERARAEGKLTCSLRAGELALVADGEQLIGIVIHRAKPAALDLTAHDLKAPLRSVMRAADALSGAALSDGERATLDTLRTAARAARAKVDQLGESRAGSANDQAAADHVFQRVCSALAATIQEASATVIAGPLPIVFLPAEDLFTLLQNLIENAIKYRSKTPPHVHVSARRDGANWVFSVSDNGRGVPAAERDRIFEMFHRGSAASGLPGTGIGLAVCRRVVERVGGRIWCESSSGTTFCFTLPAIQLVPTRSDEPSTTADLSLPRVYPDLPGE
jgi:signal transduction histidine kinase